MGFRKDFLWGGVVAANQCELVSESNQIKWRGSRLS